VIAFMLTIELLSFATLSQRALAVYRALQATVPASVRLRTTTRYQGGADVLAVWGPGGPDRFAPMAAQLAAGGHVLALDLPYWQRETKFRVSIDAAHPQRWVMRRDWPASRLAADKVPVANRWNPKGPVIVAGIGRKARVQYGHAVEDWEADVLTAAARRWPDRAVLYRQKQPDAPVPHGARLVSTARPIEEVLAGASLVMTWHSNVAVDAIRLGIPVICQDGAAAAVCARGFEVDDPQPLPESIRDRFLQNLAWFQWAPTEAAAWWRWMPEVLS
jgi:hypothetical protein